MAISRYDGRKIVINDSDMYRNKIRERGQKLLKQYVTGKMIYPTAAQISKLNIIPHVWSYGDRYSKLAYEFYGDTELWWVLAWYNKKPTDFHVKMGDSVYIPLPLNSILRFLDV
jgi:hypothetical protein